MSLSLIVIILTILPIALGLLLGILRGSRRSILRIVLIAVCVAVAFLCSGALTDTLCGIDVGDGKTLDQAIAGMLGEQFSGAQDVLLAIAKSIINVISFLAIFTVTQFLTWIIVFPIFKIFIKKGEKPHRIIGGAVGAVQGVVVALVLCIMLNGLFFNVGKIAASADAMTGGDKPAQTAMIVANAEGESGSGDPSSDNSMKDVLKMFTEYGDSGVSSMYNAIGGGIFNMVAKTTINEKEYTLEGQINAFKAVADMYSSITPYLTEGNEKAIDFSAGIVECADSIKDLCDELDKINNGLSDESKDTINTLIATVASGSGVDINLSSVDFKQVDFKKEGQVISDLASYAQKENFTQTDAEKIVADVFESDVIIAVLETNDKLDLKIPEDKKDLAETEIKKLEEQGKDAAKIASLKNIFGITDASDEQPQA